ncbi:RNA polymerase II subunit M [Brevipalpus obovatus]|uniref:RNA polymerase II subunit M n=1 Tax=Brevipalpus obovatus TaxID=246614 RepID=UPI003D9DBC15
MDIPRLTTLNYSILRADSRECDLRSMSLVQLREVIERQEKLLKNKRFIGSLADKGEKIIKLRDKAAEILKNKELVEQTTSILSNLNLGIDLKHPLAAAGSNVTLSSEVDPYAAIISKALDEPQIKPKPRYTLNKSKHDLKSESSSSISPASGPQEDRNQSVALTDSNQHIFSPNPVEPNDSPMSSNSNNDKKKERYKDTGVEFLPPSKPVSQLSVEESLALSKEQIKKEQRNKILVHLKTAYNYSNSDSENDDGEVSDEDNILEQSMD